MKTNEEKIKVIKILALLRQFKRVSDKIEHVFDTKLLDNCHAKTADSTIKYYKEEHQIIRGIIYTLLTDKPFQKRVFNGFKTGVEFYTYLKEFINRHFHSVESLPLIKKSNSVEDINNEDKKGVSLSFYYWDLMMDLILKESKVVEDDKPNS